MKTEQRDTMHRGYMIRRSLIGDTYFIMALERDKWISIFTANTFADAKNVIERDLAPEGE
jgi:hypothetical protein